MIPNRFTVKTTCSSRCSKAWDEPLVEPLGSSEGDWLLQKKLALAVK
jgi:hypothetical protein